MMDDGDDNGDESVTTTGFHQSRVSLGGTVLLSSSSCSLLAMGLAGVVSPPGLVDRAALPPARYSVAHHKTMTTSCHSSFTSLVLQSREVAAVCHSETTTPHATKGVRLRLARCPLNHQFTLKVCSSKPVVKEIHLANR